MLVDSYSRRKRIVALYAFVCFTPTVPPITRALANPLRPHYSSVRFLDRRQLDSLRMSSISENSSDEQERRRSEEIPSLKALTRVKEDGLDDFCETVDEFGCGAYEDYSELDGENDYRWIRVEKGKPPDLESYTSAEAVLKKIEEVRSGQGQHGRADLYPRQWKNAAGYPVSDELVNGEALKVFSIAQFNALAEGLSAGPDEKTPFQIDPNNKHCQKDEKQTYGGFTSIPCPSVVLDFSLRRWRILEVLLKSGGDGPCDILAMEEIDRYRGFFAPMLQLFGFEGIFMPKTRSPGVRMGWYSDGCCLFWKKDLFQLVSEFRQEYKMGNQVMIHVVLRHRPTGKSVVVAVTHLKAQSNEQNEMIRSKQIEELMERVEETVQRVKKTDDVSEVPTVIVGDFNADPPSEVEFKESVVRRVLDSGKEYASVYDVEPPPDSLFTTWKTRGPKTLKRIIDYIFYRGNIKCHASLDVPSEEGLEPSKLPGLRYPSDHMLIAAKFYID
jgi:mRNA deadenylase 3'-5' endonuclease subunit Ccr4